MCVILQNMRGKTPAQLLEENNISNVPPVNVSLLLKNLGIKEVSADFKNLERFYNVKDGDILGITFAQGDQLNIMYRYTDTLNRKRFTIAHELAHCCLNTDDLRDKHVEFRNKSMENDPREMNANIFAGELLIPYNSLIRVYNQLIVPALSSLATIFQVSTNVMAERLNYLGLVYEKDRQLSED